MFFLAIHSDQNVQKCALIRKAKNQLYIEHLRTIPIDVKPLYILRPILYGKSYELVTGLETQDLLLRTLTLKLKSKREILSVLPFQVENLFPHTKEDLLILPTLYPRKQEGETEVFLLASTKTTLDKHLQTLAPLDVDPDIVSCVPLALFRFARHFLPEYPSLCLHHLGKTQSTFAIIKEGKLQAAHTQNFGADDLCTEGGRYAEEMERTIAYLQKKNPDIHHLLCVGSSKGAEKLLPLFSPHFSILDVKTAELKEYAVPIGLCLDAAIGDTQSGQFRLKEMSSKKKTEKRKKQQIGTLVSALCFSLLLFFMGNGELSKKEQTILRAVDAPPHTSLSSFTQQLELSLSDAKPTVPLFRAPKVNEVLYWLSTHPHLSEKCSIERISYTLTSPPKLGSKIHSSQAKIELEFSSSDPQMARSFHQALLKDKQMIDQKTDLKWTNDHGVYKVCFLLKNRPLR